MMFAQQIPFWLLNKAISISTKEPVLEQRVVDFLMEDPFKNSEGKLCLVQPIKAEKILRLKSFFPVAGIPEKPETKLESDALAGIELHAPTMLAINRLYADILEYNLKEVYFYYEN